MKDPIRLAILVASTSAMVLTLSACTVARDWHYPPDPPGVLLSVQSSKPIPARVAVLPLRDLRNQSEQPGSWVVAIPLVPYGVSTFDRPETIKDAWGNYLIHMDPSRDFARAIADELQHTGIFASVEPIGSTNAKPDLVLSGTLRSTNWRRSLTTYGLGPVGPFFWIVGAPMGNTTNTVAMDLQLSSARDPSRVLWKFSMQFEDTHLIGIYYGMGESVESYAEAVQEALKPAVADLMTIAFEHPERLQPIHARGVSTP